MIEIVKLNYIELPVNFVYTHEGFFAGAGPTIAMGLSGTDKSTSQGVTDKIGYDNSEVLQMMI